MKTYKVRIFKEFEVQAKEEKDSYGIAFANLEMLLKKYPLRLIFSSKARDLSKTNLCPESSNDSRAKEKL